MLDNWTRIAKVLSENFEVHTLDLRNHGRSFHTNEMSYKLMADDVLDYMDRQDLSKVSILGHSMGGKVALQLTKNYDFVVHRLIVADMAMRSYAVRHHQIIQALQELDWASANSRSSLQEALQIRLPMDPSVIQFLLKSAYRDSYTQSYKLRFNLQSIANHIEDLGSAIEINQEIKVPTLFIRGTHSDYVSNNDLIDAKNTFNPFVYVDIEAGHWLHAEQPNQFISAVQKFLK
jgi:pimeloyl-ACP methyl ester carboxylesterase